MANRSQVESPEKAPALPVQKKARQKSTLRYTNAIWAKAVTTEE